MGRFSEETDESFSYICKQKDLDYWLEANAPVVLFTARLSDRAIFWKSVQSWFADADNRRSRKVVFHKIKDALNAEPLFLGLASAVASLRHTGPDRTVNPKR